MINDSTSRESFLYLHTAILAHTPSGFHPEGGCMNLMAINLGLVGVILHQKPHPHIPSPTGREDLWLSLLPAGEG